MPAIPIVMEVKTVAPGTSEYEATLALRRRVLRWPLGLDFTSEDLAREVDDVHLAGFEGEQLVACAVLTDVEGVAKMRQVAVEPSLQGAGLGRRLVAAFEALARDRGFEEIVLNARESAVPFYLALGYELVGEPFVEVSLPHRRMRKPI